MKPMYKNSKEFEFERKKHFDFYLPYYQSKNWLISEDNINGEKKSDWDVELEIFAGEFRRIDEKARMNDFGDCLIEIIQDIKTKNWGWFFSNKDWILYGSWEDIESNYPSSLYLIKARELEEFICGLEGFAQICISKKGWGTTWNLKLEWQDLIEKRIAEKII